MNCNSIGHFKVVHDCEIDFYMARVHIGLPGHMQTFACRNTQTLLVAQSELRKLALFSFMELFPLHTDAIKTESY